MNVPVVSVRYWRWVEVSWGNWHWSTTLSHSTRCIRFLYK